MKAIRTSVTVNKVGLRNKNSYLINGVQRGAEKAVMDIADAGRKYAYAKAPIDTGLTRQGIRVLKKRNEKGRFTAELISANMHRGPRARKFNLPYWMTFAKYAPVHIKSGSPRYMKLAEKYMNRIKTDMANRYIKRLGFNKVKR